MKLHLWRLVTCGSMAAATSPALAQAPIKLDSHARSVGRAVAGGAHALGFLGSLGKLVGWFFGHSLWLVASLAVLYLLACLLTWGLGSLRSVRPLAAPRLGTFLAFVLWIVTGVFLWPLLGLPGGFLPALVILLALHWGLLLLLVLLAAGLSLALLISGLRRNAA